MRDSKVSESVVLSAGRLDWVGGFNILVCDLSSYYLYIFLFFSYLLLKWQFNACWRAISKYFHNNPFAHVTKTLNLNY